MRRADLVELVLLASLWGASFLFTRVAVPAFGPVVLIALRVAVAALFLWPVYALRGGTVQPLRQHWRPLLWLGILNSSIPFSLFAYSLLTLSAGTASVLNAGAPLFTALLAVIWGHERLPRWRWFGLGIGVVGVLILMGGPETLTQLPLQHVLAAVAALGATFFYAVASNFTRRYLHGVPPLAVATGSQIGAALVMAPLAVWLWPAEPPSPGAWAAAAGLGVLCTGLAYVLFFRLIANVGPIKAMSVTFLIPLFGVFWGMVFLGEPLTAEVMGGCAVILLGTALSTGLWPRPGRY